MRTAVKVLAFSTAFSLVVAVVYWFVSYEPAGSVLLTFMVAASLLVGAWLALRTWRARTAGDDARAEHAAEAGTEVGRFPVGSLWPLVMAIGAGIAGLGLIYGVWLLAPGLLLFAWAAIGLTAESHD